MNDVVLVHNERRSTTYLSVRYERRYGIYEEESRKALLAAEQRWPNLAFIDAVDFHEGAFVGYFLNIPYDWNILDPYLMKNPEE